MVPPNFKEIKRKDIPLQDQFIVAFGLQCAVLAKCVKGLYDATCDELRVVMLGGAALVIEAKKEMKIIAPAIIGFLYFEDGCQELVARLKTMGEIVIYMKPPQLILREFN